jgi:hypothetical protein
MLCHRPGAARDTAPPQRILVLQDGAQYHVPASMIIQRYTLGTRVCLYAEDRDGRRYVTRILTQE